MDCSWLGKGNCSTIFNEYQHIWQHMFAEWKWISLHVFLHVNLSLQILWVILQTFNNKVYYLTDKFGTCVNQRLIMARNMALLKTSDLALQFTSAKRYRYKTFCWLHSTWSSNANIQHTDWLVQFNKDAHSQFLFFPIWKESVANFFLQTWWSNGVNKSCFSFPPPLLLVLCYLILSGSLSLQSFIAPYCT